MSKQGLNMLSMMYTDLARVRAYGIQKSSFSLSGKKHKEKTGSVSKTAKASLEMQKCKENPPKDLRKAPEPGKGQLLAGETKEPGETKAPGEKKEPPFAGQKTRSKPELSLKSQEGLEWAMAASVILGPPISKRRNRYEGIAGRR